jgi:hypothetical protein
MMVFDIEKRYWLGSDEGRLSRSSIESPDPRRRAGRRSRHLSCMKANCAASKPERMGNLHQELNSESFHLPNAPASQFVSIAANGVVGANNAL